MKPTTTILLLNTLDLMVPTPGATGTVAAAVIAVVVPCKYVVYVQCFPFI